MLPGSCWFCALLASSFDLADRRLPGRFAYRDDKKPARRFAGRLHQWLGADRGAQVGSARRRRRALHLRSPGAARLPGRRPPEMALRYITIARPEGLWAP